ncbi:glycoside hydrolase family 95 protein [Plebeiibacterium marinum]|uniref:Glycoside hydrolase family 95 protein n=1 Tax=Plebeiibacterium marinum TaxID=2992111 RepID=A0AAE3SJA9_9BACT|nr:glycoside hydrolase family 95 protein [Plebeiobacterium marinum]MCW3805565.1 glycoside hydrolase family 95 protein [Plebeiobacterium marinum]
MKNLIYFMGLIITLMSCSKDDSKKVNLLKLWYSKPATAWEEALPLGNGRLGAMVFGTVEKEHLQLNEETVWAGEPGNNLPKGFRDVLPRVRELIFAGRYKEAEELTMTVTPRHAPEWNNYGMPYQTVGDLFIEFPHQQNYSNYYRELDISNAISKTSYQVDGTTFNREYFISAPEQVMVVRLTASKKGQISCTLKMDSPHSKHKVSTLNKQLILTGNGENVKNKKGKIRFYTSVKPVLSGGELIQGEDHLNIKNADTVTVFLSIGTNFKNYKDISGDETKVSEGYLANAINEPYGALKSNHIKDYKQYFDRVELDLGITDSIKKPIDQRIVDFNKGYDPQLVSLYFQFGRYLLISSSRPGTQPANLQGIWNHKNNPPWDSKYTVNINTEMNYWPAEVTNLSEMHQPLFSMLKDLSVTGQETAKEMYGARGWAMHHNTDIWRITGPVDGAFYGMWPMGGAWLTQHLWYHYLYSGDKSFLKEIYPILKGAALYYADVLQQEPENGWMVVSPCMSPENKHPHQTSMAAGNTMDNQLVFDVFSNLMAASDILDTDKDFAREVKALFDKLPPMQIGKHSQLQEWLQDWDRTDDHHRHVSHLYGLFPGSQISPFSNPELFQSAKNSLIYRGDKSTGWSMGWKVNLWARLLDGNRAFKLIKDQLSPAPIEKKGEHGGTYPNLFDAHPPFQIDGNFGCTSGIAEMLLQSYDGDIYLLPALPDEWEKGSVKGLKTIGGFTIDMIWDDWQVKQLVVHSSVGGNCRLRIINNLEGTVALNKVKDEMDNPNPLFSKTRIKTPIISKKASFQSLELPHTNLVEFDTEKGQNYVFRAL